MTTENIKLVIEKYTKVDDEIKELNKKIKNLRMEKNTLGEQITDYLMSHSQDSTTAVLSIGKNSFKVVSSKKKTFKRELLEPTIKNYILDKPEETCKLILEEITEEKEVNFLKRTTKK